MYSFHNRLLKIDTSSKSCETQKISDELLSKHLDGKGMATQQLLQLNPPGVDPL